MQSIMGLREKARMSTIRYFIGDFLAAMRP
jgi:hypothetical protein